MTFIVTTLPARNSCAPTGFASAKSRILSMACFLRKEMSWVYYWISSLSK